MKKRDISRIINLLERIQLRNQLILEFHKLPVLARTNREIDRELERLEKCGTTD